MKKLIMILAVVLIAATAQAQPRFSTDTRTATAGIPNGRIGQFQMVRPDAGIQNLRSSNAQLPYDIDPRALQPSYTGGGLFNDLYR